MFKYHPENDAYARLGIRPDSGPEDIQRAFEERMAEVQEDARRLIEAREILVDPQRRMEHDRARAAYREALKRRQLLRTQRGGIGLGVLVFVGLVAAAILLAAR